MHEMDGVDIVQAIIIMMPCCVHLMQAVADIIRTTLGPKAMLKMLLDASGGRWWLDDGWLMMMKVHLLFYTQVL